MLLAACPSPYNEINHNITPNQYHVLAWYCIYYTVHVSFNYITKFWLYKLYYLQVLKENFAATRYGI